MPWKRGKRGIKKKLGEMARNGSKLMVSRELVRVLGLQSIWNEQSTGEIEQCGKLDVFLCAASREAAAQARAVGSVRVWDGDSHIRPSKPDYGHGEPPQTIDKARL